MTHGAWSCRRSGIAPDPHLRVRGGRAWPRTPTRSRRREHGHDAAAGVTLLEVLVALALAALVVLGAARHLATGRAAEVSGLGAADAVLALDLAANVLVGEVRRAGYSPFPYDGAVPGANSEATLRLVLRPERAEGDAVSVRFLDDRLARGVVLRDLTFEAADDNRGAPQLYRITASGVRQPLVQGVTRLAVAGWVDAAGMHPRRVLMAGALRPWALILRLESGSGAHTRLLTVPLPSRPSATVVEAGS